MLKITGLKLNISHTEEELLSKASKELKVMPRDIKSYRILKKSIDARKGVVKYIYSIEVEIADEKNTLTKKYIVNNNNVTLTNRKYYDAPESGNDKLNLPPVIVGSGPAGLFCAYQLSLLGYKPILIERGESVDERCKTVNRFWDSNSLNTESNVQFGEGGAGTFSDGKLNTLVNDKLGRNTYVLDTFCENGAPESITYDSKPHIGTDILKDVVKNMRNSIIEAGGTVRFNTKLTDMIYKDGRISEIEVNNSEKIPCEVLVLALGHSARDTFEMLYNKKLVMEPKSFAVGVRIEHPQEMINLNQYGEHFYKSLPAAPYKLAKNVSTGRNVYSFCMCPGGYVVNASSEKDRLAVNGMSYSARDSHNANSALIVNVNPADFDEPDNPLSGLKFQRKLESAAYLEGKTNIPVQLYGDYKQNTITKTVGSFEPCIKGRYNFANLNNIFPEYINKSIVEGIESFTGIIKNYNRNDAIMSGVESRTSSPLRITRNDNFESNINGIYPCGEGAGYAGGIMSAAMDGLKVSEAIIAKYALFDV